MTTVLDVQRFKDEGRRFAMLTAYDFLSARILDEAGIPILLVGDSLGMVMLGYPTTLPVTLDEMIPPPGPWARGRGRRSPGGPAHSLRSPFWTPRAPEGAAPSGRKAAG